MNRITIDKAKRYIVNSYFQITRELVVFDSEENIIERPYPKTMGNKLVDHPYVRPVDGTPKIVIETPVSKSVKEVHRDLQAITEVLQFELVDNTIWPFSVANKTDLLSVYVGFSFSEAFFAALSEDNPTYSDLETLKTDFYQALDLKIERYQWLMSYLNGATPFKADDLFVRSMSYSDEVQYGENKKHHFSLNKTAPLPVSVRLDLNPYEETAVSIEQIEAIQLFLMTMIWEWENVDQVNGMALALEVAREEPSEMTQYRAEAKSLLEVTKRMIYSLNIGYYFIDTFHLIERLFAQPDKTIAGRMTANKDLNTLKKEGIKRARAYHKEVTEKRYALFGYTHMEISTQMVIYDAIIAGIKFELIDEKAQLLRLSIDNHKEYVHQATRTAKVPYISAVILENKLATKVILKENGFNVPDGEAFYSRQEAKLSYVKFSNKAIVVKPKSTNGGIGITVFVEPPAQEYYEEAIDTAFDLDDTVLVEEYYPGEEYRYHIQDGEIKDILYREPANVVGDGEHTIKELVAIKNKNPARGQHDRMPMVTIELNSVEVNRLREQGLSGNTIPEKGKKIYLRENSNVSTGGEAQSYLGIVDESYSRIAEAAAEALNAPVNGLDLIIPDIHKESTADDPGYVIIEGNANPGLYAHMFLAEGRGVRLSMHLLNMLFPELGLEPDAGNY